MREFPNEVLLQVFSHLSRSDWKSVRLLSKAWSVTGAKQVFDEIRVGPSDRAMLSLMALSNHEHLREIPSRLRVEAQLVQPNLSVHEFLNPSTSLAYFIVFVCNYQFGCQCPKSRRCAHRHGSFKIDLSTNSQRFSSTIKDN